MRSGVTRGRCGAVPVLWCCARRACAWVHGDFRAGIWWPRAYVATGHIFRFPIVDAHSLQHPELHGRGSSEFHLARLVAVLVGGVASECSDSPRLSTVLDAHKAGVPNQRLVPPRTGKRGTRLSPMCKQSAMSTLAAKRRFVRGRVQSTPHGQVSMRRGCLSCDAFSQPSCDPLRHLWMCHRAGYGWVLPSWLNHSRTNRSNVSIHSAGELRMPIGAADGLAVQRLSATTLVSISESRDASSRTRSEHRECPATHADLNASKVAIEPSLAHESKPTM